MNNEYRNYLIKALNGLKKEHQKGVPGAIYEALHVSIDYSRMHDHDIMPDEDIEMVEVPTWLVKAAIQVIGNELKNSQSNGTGKSAKWLTRLEQEGADFFRSITVNDIQDKLQCSKAEALRVLASHQNLTPDAIRKSIFRSENSSNISNFEGGFYQYVCNLSRE